MIRKLTGLINHILDNKFGLRIQPSADERLAHARNQLLRASAPELVLDVGANEGQWARRLREDGYKNRILSFEPSEAFESLSKRVWRDENWQCQKLAVSNINGQVNLFSASNGNLSTSILRPNAILNQGFNLEFESKNSVESVTLEKILSTYEFSSFYLKIDVQGAEMLVLEGAGRTLDYCIAIEFESALISLYHGETTHYPIADWLRAKNFEPFQVAITHWDKELRTISLDSIFINTKYFDPENIVFKDLVS